MRVIIYVSGISRRLIAIDEKISHGIDDLSLFYAIDDILNDCDVKPVYAKNCNWFDIDSPDDFSKALANKN
jgi:hypothetical protein